MPAVPALERLRQEDWESKPGLHSETLCQIAEQMWKVTVSRPGRAHRAVLCLPVLSWEQGLVHTVSPLEAMRIFWNEMVVITNYYLSISPVTRVNSM